MVTFIMAADVQCHRHVRATLERTDWALLFRDGAEKNKAARPKAMLLTDGDRGTNGGGGRQVEEFPPRPRKLNSIHFTGATRCLLLTVTA